MSHTETHDIRGAESPRATGGRGRAFVWRLVLYAHLVAAIMWWWLMPGGFPISHPRFWTNEVFPLLAAGVCLSCLFAERPGKAIVRVSTAATIPAFWAAATLTAAITFPQSALRFLPPALPCTMAAVGLFWMTFRLQPIPWRKMIAAVVPAMAAAAAVVLAQRGDDPATRPANHSLTVVDPNVEMRVAALPVHLSDQVEMRTVDGRVFIHRPRANDEPAAPAAAPPRVPAPVHSYLLEVEPLLTFDSRSPDRCWTIFAPTGLQTGPPRKLTALRQEDRRPAASYRDDTNSVLLAVASEAEVTTIESATRLERPIYSHLNSFAAFTIHGCRDPAVSFSPCPDVLVAVEPSDYPVGRPLRLAYVDKEDIFHVVSAKSGEKGPFSEFGRGPLPRAEPLTITIYDGRRSVFSITLDDWASQAGRSLSPTAGWGLPVNAIEFSRVGGADSGTFTIWTTLAATSVGRGWDSVGHAAGTYRNRIRVTVTDPDRGGSN